MFQHVAVRENDNKSTTAQYQVSAFNSAVASFDRSQKQGFSLKVKRYANNELRVTWGQERPPMKRSGSEAGAERCLKEAEASLVYNGKVQQRGDLVLPPVPRARGKEPTRYAMHYVREAVWIQERIYKKNALFVTLTLAGRTPAAVSTFAQHSTPIMGNLTQRIRHFLKEFPVDCLTKNHNYDCVWVAEYHQDGALHYHLVLGYQDEAIARILRKLIPKWWRKILLDYSEKTGVDLFERRDGGTWKDCPKKPRTQIVKVKKSVSRYMSKYISKGARGNFEDGWMPPACWYHVSSGLRERVLAERQINAIKFLSIDTAEEKVRYLVDFAQQMGAKVLTSVNPITQQVCGYVLFFEGDRKDIAWTTWNDDIERWRAESGVVRNRDGPVSPWCHCEHDYLRGVDLIFDAKPFNARLSGCADLCAPFSAPEKGGGMRYDH